MKKRIISLVLALGLLLGALPIATFAREVEDDYRLKIDWTIVDVQEDDIVVEAKIKFGEDEEFIKGLYEEYPNVMMYSYWEVWTYSAVEKEMVWERTGQRANPIITLTDEDKAKTELVFQSRLSDNSDLPFTQWGPTEITPDTFYRCWMILDFYKNDIGSHTMYGGTVNSYPDGIKTLAKPYGDTPFRDIGDHWSKDNIVWAYENELFTGTSEDKFSPNDKMNRGMFATVLWRLDGEPESDVNLPFDDVDAKRYYYPPVKWAYENELIKGTSDEEFTPNGNITREQIAAIIFRYAGLEEEPSGGKSLEGFADSDKVSKFAKEAMEWAYGNGIINGKTATTLDPQGQATRAEVAAMVKRFVEE